MDTKRILITALLVIRVHSASHWFDIGDGIDKLASASLAGPNEELLIQGNANSFKVFTINWSTGTASENTPVSYPISTKFPTDKNSLIQADETYNCVMTSKSICRLYLKSDQPTNFQEYSVVEVVNGYSRPIWVKNTVFFFAASNASPYKFYRFHSDTVTDVKQFLVTQKSNAFGVLSGTPWLIISFESSTQRKLFDYTNGYVGGTNPTTSIHTKLGTNGERGILSPEDGRGVYVLTGFNSRILHAINVNDGSELLNHDLSTSITSIRYGPVWITDSDFCVQASYNTNFAIVNFINTNLIAPSYKTVPSGAEEFGVARIWKYYRTLALPSRTKDRSYLFQITAMF